MISAYGTIGKQAVCLATGKQLGTINNIIIKQTKVNSLCISLDTDSNEEYMTIPIRNVCSLDSDFVTIKSFANTAAFDSNPTSRILGLDVIDELGKKQYQLRDILFDEKTKVVKHLLSTDNKKYNLSTVNIGKDFIVLKGKIRACKQIHTFPCQKIYDTNKISKSTIEQQQIAKPEEKLSIKLSPQMLMPTAQTPDYKPSKIIADYAFLLGRTATNTLMHDNKILVMTGQKLTTNNLETIIKSGNLSFALKYSMADFS